MRNPNEHPSPDGTKISLYEINLPDLLNLIQRQKQLIEGMLEAADLFRIQTANNLDSWVADTNASGNHFQKKYQDVFYYTNVLIEAEKKRLALMETQANILLTKKDSLTVQ